jgi:release factor glutamine methyltransferase
MTKAGAPAPLTFDPDLSRAAAQRMLTQAFTDVGLESAALDARILLCVALGIDHIELIRDPDLPIGPAALRLDEFAQRRMRHEPVSRIIGSKEVFGQTYTIDASVLDPRPDTECLVEAVLEIVKMRKSETLRILDLGIGSGAILGALLGELPHATGIGIDRSQAACERACANLSAIGLADRTSMLVGNWLASIRGCFDIIVSNPPYIVSADIDGLDPEVRLHDPRLALDGGSDGLDAYRAILSDAASHLARDGLLAFELGDGQFAAVETLIRLSGLEPIGSKRDLAGRVRVVLAGLKSGS